jgi:hypothetical protein
MDGTDKLCGLENDNNIVGNISSGTDRQVQRAVDR